MSVRVLPADDWELRVCNGCGREHVRHPRESRLLEFEVPCAACKGDDFTLYDLVAVEQAVPYTPMEV